MKFITTTDKTTGEEVKLAYYDYGWGKPVILIHGWPLSKEMFEYQVEALIAGGSRVIAYDRRGFGHSDRPWNGYDYDTLTDDLKAVIDGLNVKDITLLGFSMGGGEVARYFTRYGGANVSKAILVSSIVPYLLRTDDNPDGVPQDQMQDLADKAKQDRIGFLDTFGKQFFGVSLVNHPLSAPLLEYYRMLGSMASPRATLECMKSFSYTDFRNDAMNITVPTLIIHGDSDKIVPIETSGQRAAQLIKNNQFVVYEGAPHGLFYTEKERLNQDLVNFIIGNETVASDFVATTSATTSVVLPSNDEGLVTR